MGDEEEGPGLLDQKILQPADGVHVQMVGRFVEKKDVRLTGQGPGQQGLALHAAGQGGELRLGIQPQVGDDRVDLAGQAPAGLFVEHAMRPRKQRRIYAGVVMPLAPQSRQTKPGLARSGSDHVIDRTCEIGRNFLRQGRRGQALAEPHLARIGDKFAGQDAHERGLALAVAAKETDAFARMNLQTDVVQQERTGK